MSKKRHGRLAWSRYFSTSPASANATWPVNGNPNWHHLYHSIASSFLQSCPHRIRNVGEFSIKSFTNNSKSLITLLGKVVLFQLPIFLFNPNLLKIPFVMFLRKNFKIYDMNVICKFLKFSLLLTICFISVTKSIFMPLVLTQARI